MDLIARLATAERNTVALQQREGEARRLVLAELDALGPFHNFSGRRAAPSCYRLAPGVERTHETAAKTRRDLDAALRKATGAVQRKRKDLEKGEDEWKEWTAAWEAALKVLQFPAMATPETAEVQIDAMDNMRGGRPDQ